MDWIQTHIPPWFWIAIIAHGVILGTVAYLILLERKVASWVQDRIGPNRVGLGFGIIPFLKNRKMFGLGQPLADGLKFIFKEDYRPAHVDRILFTVAPMVMILTVIISIAVIPWGGTKRTTREVNITRQDEAPEMTARKAAIEHMPSGATLVGNPTVRPVPGTAELLGPDTHPAQMIATITYDYPFQIASLNIGVLYILAVLSLAVYGVVVGGWASNNKYSFLGGLRATANMISYEIPLGLCVLCIVIMFGSLDLATIVDKQAGYWLGVIPKWNVFTQPIAFVLFLVCIHAEANRAPFDLAEAEQELVGGYHTEYSSMRFALFFLAEYAGMITTSCLLVALFFGGWHFPGLAGKLDPNNPALTDSLLICILRGIVFFAKAIVVLFVFMWVRWSLPRFRFDQVMQLAWRALIPITLALVVATTVLVYLSDGRTLDGVDGVTALMFLTMNIGVLCAVFAASLLLPAPPDTNRKISVEGSRYATT